MIPNNYESLKSDEEFLFQIKSLPNIKYWHIDRTIASLHKDVLHLQQLIQEELKELGEIATQ